uniref:Uncharacterized protein n=1 Tax=Tanacetum cinerariifolium TaxID=118510 RepID=A0A699J8K1_TANCI|nr:hypothetical protein [Tanacetum cinerariifolium]
MNVLLLHLIERRGEMRNKRLDHLKQDQTMLMIKRFSDIKNVFRERKLIEKFVQRVTKDDRRVVERKKSTMPKLPLDVCSLSFGAPRDRSYEIVDTKQGGDFDVSVVHLQTCLSDILGFLEKFRGGFEQDIDDDGKEDKEDKEELFRLSLALSGVHLKVGFGGLEFQFGKSVMFDFGFSKTLGAMCDKELTS